MEEHTVAKEGCSSRTYSASLSTLSDDLLVGVDDKLYSIKDRLTGYRSKLDVLSIVGMGGIGKTALARKIYNDRSIADYFDVRVWTTLSQKCELADILLGLMQQFCQDGISKINYLESSRAVGEQLWRGLRGQRYLVVIDDIWDVEAWKSLRIFFPDDCNGSRIILTSRIVEVVNYVNNNYPPYELSLMDLRTSWELLSEKVFSKDSCPEALVPIGNAIALKCQGLPLAINVVAGHLSKVGRTYLDWHNVEKKLPSIQGNVLNILALSYNYLSVHLQKCFLFAANEYAEVHERKSRREPGNLHWVPTKILMSLWIAAGYIHAEAPRSLEDVAEECLQELTSGNLIILTSKGYRGIPKSYSMHDLLIDMYWRLDVERLSRRSSCDIDKFDRWESMNNSYSHDIYPFALFGGHKQVSDRLLLLIREDFSVSMRGYLKHLEISTSSTIPLSVYKLHNLQTLINKQALPGETLPRDVWLMSKLRHLHVGDITYLPSPRQSHKQELDFPILENLQSVTLSSASCTQEICEGIPNVRRLRLYEIGTECNVEEQSLNCLNNLIFLSQLHNLRLRLQDPPRCLRHWKSPPNLGKLTLEGICLTREDTTVLASLPNLEVLKLKYCDFEKNRWLLEHDDDIFHKLRFLLLESFGLHLWEANRNNFPNLRHLVLRNCSYLKRIPLEMAEICTLQVIELYRCRRTVEESAREIQQEQCDMGNEDFKVHISRLYAKYRQS